jgi:hypothetical protein
MLGKVAGQIVDVRNGQLFSAHFSQASKLWGWERRVRVKFAVGARINMYWPVWH